MLKISSLILSCCMFLFFAKTGLCYKNGLVNGHTRTIHRLESPFLSHNSKLRQNALIVRNIKKDSDAVEETEETEGPSPFEQVASKGLAGVLAIAVAESIFWALGVPLAAIYYKYTTGEWIDVTTADGQLKAAGFSFGYGGFATVILQYRVTLFAIPLIPLMEKLVVEPGKKYFGENFGEKKEEA